MVVGRLCNCGDETEKEDEDESAHRERIYRKATVHVTAIVTMTSAKAPRFNRGRCRVFSQMQARIAPKASPARKPPKCARISEPGLKPKRTKSKKPAITPLKI